MKNIEVAKVFQDIADLLELRGENVFKIRAYQKAARAIEHYPKELNAMIDEGEDLHSIPGVGEAIAKKTTELITTGKLGYYENLKAEFPQGITNLLAIPGIGPKTANKLSSELGISSVDELERAINDGRVAQLFRLGEKTADNILHQIQALRRKDQRIPIGEALPIVEEIIVALGTIPGVRNLTPAGSLRRFRETVGDIDLMGTADNPKDMIDAFAALPQVSQVLAQGSTKASVIVSGGLQVDLRMVEHDSFGSLLQYFTGNKQHNIALREKWHKQGLKLSEYGITVVATGKLEKFATEEEFYNRLGLQYIPPELREAQGEIERAEQGAIPKLVELSDIKGDLHTHTEWSDGHDSVEELARAAKDRGYQYIAVTEHSVGRGIAHGLDMERLREQIAEIRAVNERLTGIRVLTGIEVDIRADGSLDLPHEILSGLDIVIAAVHSAMNQSEEKMTRRVIDAIEDPDVDMIAHPTCRLIGEREPVAMDLEAVFRAAAKYNKIVEINAMPDRLDLKDTHAFRARDLGLKLAIGTDSHSIAHLGFMRFGVGVARRAWCEPQHILNTLPLGELLAVLDRSNH
ncbi:MAG: DNA polymerase/3'-5' exonuclease PolX [Dehalococcoidia bacterium]|nr:DNA polymerase/3'-5' exonuclease PolX [Dehalococcoidia bacterium]MDH4299031.1 DNA polymerase/3'-5' exonuclease PolX [Dehalococcoidia bacterium]MDH4367461.1 DNA polymerase/3'-5' exonuclease PolX [Dehalococcoidia bacterium]